MDFGEEPRQDRATPAMNDDCPPDLVARSNRRVWWGMAGVFVVLLGTVAWFHLFHDLPPPDPSLYHHDFKPVPAGVNAIEEFARETEKLRKAMDEDWSKRLSEEDKLSNFEPGCEASLRAHLEANRELLAKFQRLVREAPRPLVHPGLEATTDLFSASYSSLNALQGGANVWRRQMMLDVLDGRPSVARDEALELAIFAKELSGLDGTLLHWLVTLTIHSQALMALQKALPLCEWSAEEALDWAGRLKAVELDSLDCGRSYRVELKVFANTLSKWRENTTAVQRAMRVDEHSWLAQKTIKPNMTVLEAAEIHAPLVRALEAGWSQGLTAAEDLNRIGQAMTNRKDWRTWAHPNLMGRVLIAMNLGSSRVIVQKSAHAVALNRCLQAALALRASELKEGSTPERLEALVPQFLTVLPEDPVTGLALQWNSQTGRLYSVGLDGLDGGGDFEPGRPRSGDKDWGLEYPWNAPQAVGGSPP